MAEIVCMWSGPRNLSTAMMRSFGSRADCSVLDEPFFAPFLILSGKDHPGREETLARHETDPDRVVDMCLAEPPGGETYVFQKHMPHHMIPAIPRHWMQHCRHFFLIREPARVIASYIKGRSQFDIEDLGFQPQRELFRYITQLTGVEPPIIESDDILSQPDAYLRLLCDALDIPFDANMLKWEAGERPEDGAWAPYWYKSVENSTGFGPAPNSPPTIANTYRGVLAACEEEYKALRARKLRLKSS